MIDINAHDSAWVLLSSGDKGGNAGRFAKDLAYVREAILLAGVQQSQVKTLVDDPLMKPLLAAEGIPPAEIDDMPNAAAVFAGLTTSGFLGVVVSGHGDHQAIATATPIKATTILGWMATVSGVTSGALVLGQCYAGVFRYVDARNPPPVAILGAANFESSFSLIGIQKARPRAADWMANPFLVYFADWLVAPEDVDGDGALTILDAFRHASVKTMEVLHSARVVHALDLQKRLLDRRADFDAAADPATKQASAPR